MINLFLMQNLKKYASILIFAISIIPHLSLIYFFVGRFNRQSIWIDQFFGLPPIKVILISLLIVSISLYKFRFNFSANLFRVLIIILFSLYWLSSKNFGDLGDSGWWRYLATGKQIWLSEPFSNLIQKLLVTKLWNVELINLAAPTAGICSLIILLSNSKIITESYQKEIYLVPIFILGTALPFLFSFGYLENTFLAVPFYLLFLAFTYREFEFESNWRIKPRTLGAISLAASTLMHGQFLLLAPTLIFIPLLNYESNIRIRLRNIFLDLFAYVFTASLGIFLLWIAKFELVLGNIKGGGDHNPFVFFSERKDLPSYRFKMISMEHVLDFSSILFVLCPLIFLLPYLIYWFIKSNSLASKFHNFTFVLMSNSLAYLIFIFFFNFDLGVPLDLDLMLSLGITIIVLLGRLIFCALSGRPIILYSLLLGQLFLSEFLLAKIKVTVPVNQLINSFVW